MEKNIVSIIPHTEKSFSVYTNSVCSVLKHRDSLNNLGGVFDANIKTTPQGESYMGWIFFIDKKEQIQKWINDGCPPVQKKKSVLSDEIKQEIKQKETKQDDINIVNKKENRSFERILFPKKVNLSPVNTSIEIDRLKSIEKSIEILNSKFNSIELENSLLTARINSLESEISFLRNRAQNQTEDDYEIFDQIEIENVEKNDFSVQNLD